ncbi:hypothetical protein GJ496_000247 [Pomphorhynchus laevis]|nr:hypothetical protein GJ496_000247 [Pomphorhynchus laevis]
MISPFALIASLILCCISLVFLICISIRKQKKVHLKDVPDSSIKDSLANSVFSKTASEATVEVNRDHENKVNLFKTKQGKGEEESLKTNRRCKILASVLSIDKSSPSSIDSYGSFSYIADDQQAKLISRQKENPQKSAKLKMISPYEPLYFEYYQNSFI